MSDRLVALGIITAALCVTILALVIAAGVQSGSEQRAKTSRHCIAAGGAWTAETGSCSWSSPAPTSRPMPEL